MKSIILSISFRNLVRQKRRNILLGIAIAFGAMILVIASSFAHGITDVLFNRIVKYAYGHVSISYTRNGNIMNPMFPDGARIWNIVRSETKKTELAQEAIGMFARGIGNGRADNVIMVGIDLKAEMSKEDVEEYQANFKFLEGSFESLRSSDTIIPVTIAEQKAKYLNLKMGDVLRVRFTDVNNQSQSAQLTIAGIFKPANAFMSSPVFLNLEDVRRIGGYKPYQVATIQVNIKDPQKEARLLADRIHARLVPSLGKIAGTIEHGSTVTEAVALGMLSDTASRTRILSGIPLAAGDSAKAYGYEGVIASFDLASERGINAGDTVILRWQGAFDSIPGHERLIISGVARSDASLPPRSLLINERSFYNALYRTWPKIPGSSVLQSLPDSSKPIFAALAPEYRLMKRCKTTQEVMGLMREAGRAKYKGIMVQVQSMYETASDILKLEAALTLITMIAVMVLFFIILIGVVNTLRMTIRERTREIGTVRAIGMQKSDVRNVFVLETFLLALFATTTGIAAAFLAMGGLSLITINAGDNPLGMLLVKGHLHFTPTIFSVTGYVLFILIMAVVTAYFPARRAANRPAADALRHYE